jgi:hypothetical protein
VCGKSRTTLPRDLSTLEQKYRAKRKEPFAATMSETGETIEIRVLLAFEERHGTYMDAIRTAIRQCRPHAEVMVTVLEALEGEIERLEPHLLVCEPPIPENPTDMLLAFIELSIEPSQLSRFRVGQRRWESLNPGIDELMTVVADTERLLSPSP